MLRVPLFDDETLTSYCARLAAANLRTAADLCLDMGIRFQDVVDGKESAIDALAQYGLLSPDRLRKAAVFVRAGGHEVQGEIFSRRIYPRTRMRICPACFRADDSCADRMPGVRRYMRRSWPLLFLRACPMHNCQIVDVGLSPLHPPSNQDFVGSLEALDDALFDAMSNTVSRQTTEYERYLLRRLEGQRNDGPLLNEMTLASGAYLCEIVGCVATFGKDVLNRELDGDQMSQAAQNGYLLLSDGYPGLLKFLDIMHAGLSTVRPDHGGQKLYGRLYTILRDSDDRSWDGVRAAIRSYAFDTLPLAKTADIFGKRKEADFLSDSDIEELADVRPGHLRKMAVAGGFLDPSLMRHGGIPKNVACQVLDLLRDWILPQEAARLLGLKYWHFQLYREAGMFHPSLKSGNGVTINDRHSKRDLEEYVSVIRSRATSASLRGLKTINATAKITGCRSPDILQLIFRNELRTVGWDPSHVGIGALLVDPREIAQIKNAEDHERLSVRALAMTWKLPYRSISSWVKIGALPTVTALNVRTGKVSRLVSCEAADAFLTNYVSLPRAAADFGVSRQRVREAIRQAKLVPLFDSDKYRATIFDRRELERALQAIKDVPLPRERFGSSNR